MNAAQVPAALVGQQLGVGDPLLKSSTATCRQAAPAPARSHQPRPKGAVAATVGMRATFDVDVQGARLASPARVAHGVTGPRRRLPGHAVDVVEPRHHPAWRRSSRTCAPARPSWPPTRAGRAASRAGLADPLLDFGRREPRQPPGGCFGRSPSRTCSCAATCRQSGG